MTLDGFVAGPNGELDWMWIGKRDEVILQRVIELADTCDTILLRRKMTRGFIDHWENMLDNALFAVLKAVLFLYVIPLEQGHWYQSVPNNTHFNPERPF